MRKSFYIRFNWNNQQVEMKLRHWARDNQHCFPNFRFTNTQDDHPVLGTLLNWGRFFDGSAFLLSTETPASKGIAAKRLFTRGVRTTPFFLLYRIPFGNTISCRRCLLSYSAETQVWLKFWAIDKLLLTVFSRFEPRVRLAPVSLPGRFAAS